MHNFSLFPPVVTIYLPLIEKHFHSQEWEIRVGKKNWKESQNTDTVLYPFLLFSSRVVSFLKHWYSKERMGCCTRDWLCSQPEGSQGRTELSSLQMHQEWGDTRTVSAGHTADRGASSRWMGVFVCISLREQKSPEQTVQLFLLPLWIICQGGIAVDKHPFSLFRLWKLLSV